MALISKYSGLNAKVKAMQGKLLKRDDYILLAQSKKVDEFVYMLKAFNGYDQALGQLNENEYRRGFIETKIKLSLYDDFTNIYNFIDDFDIKRYLTGFYLKNEIALLKYILSSIYDERDLSANVSELNASFGKRLKVNVYDLAASKTLEQFYESLKGTVYHHLFLNQTNNNPTLFELESKLDIYYHMHLWKLKNKNLDKNNKKVMTIIDSTEIDLKNIIWGFRLNRFYNFTKAEIYSFLIPINHRLKIEQLNKIIESRSEDELWSEISQTPYGFAFDKEVSIEKGFYIAMDKIFSTLTVQNPNTLALASFYIYKKEVEIKNLTSLLECIRYGIDKDEILKYLILN